MGLRLINKEFDVLGERDRCGVPSGLACCLVGLVDRREVRRSRDSSLEKRDQLSVRISTCSRNLVMLACLFPPVEQVCGLSSTPVGLVKAIGSQIRRDGLRA